MELFLPLHGWLCTSNAESGSLRERGQAFVLLVTPNPNCNSGKKSVLDDKTYTDLSNHDEF
jgi:hypothetical protein